ncbi:MAG TPA: hypothetical protein VGD48_18460 [Kutzneria sp.]
MTTHSGAISEPLHAPLRIPPPGTGMSCDVSFALNGKTADGPGLVVVVVVLGTVTTRGRWAALPLVSTALRGTVRDWLVTVYAQAIPAPSTAAAAMAPRRTGAARRESVLMSG